LPPAFFLFMATKLSSHFRQQRINLNLRPRQVAKLLGYTSLVGAADEIVRFEETGDVDYRFFKKFAAVLGIKRATIAGLIEKDRRELVARWSEWANQPTTPHLIARLLPGYFMAQPIPEELTTLDGMESHASELAAELHQEFWLIVSRKLAVYFNAGGRKQAVQEAAPSQPLEPYRLTRESGLRFISVFDGDDIDLRSLWWPEIRGPRIVR
jgi:hypothetical protein